MFQICLKIKKIIMKITTILKPVLALIAFQFFISCGGGDDNGPSGGNAREVKYEVTGNYTGIINTSYTTANGGSTFEVINAIPWTKQITYLNTTSASIITLSGSDGTVGQTIVLKVYSGGELVSSSPATAGPQGQITVTSPVLLF